MRSLARHYRDQHPGERMPPLEVESTPSPTARRRPRTYRITMTQGETRPCPVPTCRYTTGDLTALRRHFMHRHEWAQLQIRDQAGRLGKFVQCDGCGMMVQGLFPSERHRSSELCRSGTVRRETRRRRDESAAAICDPAQFTVGTASLDYVGEFRYLGRVLAADDSDLVACIRNIGRARAKWGAISRVLRREGATPRTSARFYLVIVAAVLLYGCETWVITTRMRALLEAFHHRCARAIAGAFIRRLPGPDESWVHPSAAGSLTSAHLLPIDAYLIRRRTKFRAYARTRRSYQACIASALLTRPCPTLWDQLDTLAEPQAT